MMWPNEQKTECNGCPSKLRIPNGPILCVDMEIEPDQPVEGCPIRGKGRRAIDLSIKERNEIESMHLNPGPTYY